jgi:hypothetical protein
MEQGAFARVKTARFSIPQKDAFYSTASWFQKLCHFSKSMSAAQFRGFDLF